MAPTTITQLVMVALGVGLIAYTISLYFGDWDALVPHRLVKLDEQGEIDHAVRQMRRDIEAYERRNAS